MVRTAPIMRQRFLSSGKTASRFACAAARCWLAAVAVVTTVAISACGTQTTPVVSTRLKSASRVCA